MTTHSLQWQSPEPLWGRFGTTREVAFAAADQYRPAILRFSSDDFMDQMLGALARDPAHLGDLLARPETWRTPPAAVEPDLVERVPMPGIARAAAWIRALAKPKSSVPAVAAAAAVTERGRPAALPARTVPLKLYQPAHQRYYLVGANLVCGVAGLPDRALTPGGAEQVNFVLRRLLPPTANGNSSTAPREFAFVKDGRGARWQRVSDGVDDGQLIPGEEPLPLFPLGFRDEGQRPRTLWTGLVPVARREEYLGAAIDYAAVPLALGQIQVLQPPFVPAPKASVMARMTQFKLDVAEPWKNLIQAGFAVQTSMQVSAPSGAPDDAQKARVYAQNMQWQMQSWLILLDFFDYLATYLPDVSTAIVSGSGIDALAPPRRRLYDWLGAAAMSPELIARLANVSQVKTPAPSLRDALKAIAAASVRAGLEQTDKLFGLENYASSDWPDFHFLLSGLDRTLQCTGPFTALATLSPLNGGEAEADPVSGSESADVQTAAALLDRLVSLVARALDPGPETDAPPIPFALQLRDTLAASKGDAGSFVIRCVYLNRDCGPLHAPILSAPSQRFQLASFFDPDAPARPIRITLPLDTTAAGFRKYNKNTAFLISDVLCGQIQRAKGLGLGDLVRSVLPWPLHKDLDVGNGGACQDANGINIGMICSLSIPIITICALILLIIIVSLLDFIFRWLPYFVLCFPVPGLSGKAKGGT